MQQRTNFLVIYHKANKFVRLQVMKAYERVEKWLHTFLKSALERTQ
jgi:hypothetical protein